MYIVGGERDGVEGKKEGRKERRKEGKKRGRKEMAGEEGIY